MRVVGCDRLAVVCDRALLAFSMASALRRWKLVALTVGNLKQGPDGWRVWVTCSKADQEGRSVAIAVPDGRRVDPVAHLDAWLVRAESGDGPVFRSLVNGRVGSALADQSVPLIVKRRGKAAAPAALSLHAGFLTSAAAGASIQKVREVSRHKSVQALSSLRPEQSVGGSEP